MTERRTQFKSSMSEDNQFPDNSHSTCFICTKSFSNISNHDPMSSREYSIKTIFRYLKIYEKLKVNTNDDDLVDIVPFCDPCYKLFTKISGYCADLEIFQIKIQYYLNQLNEQTVVKFTREDCATASINKARNQLKSKLVKKCSSKKQIGPVVILPQLEMEQMKREKYQRMDSHPAYLTEDDYGPSDDEIVDMSDGQDHTSDDDFESKASASSKSKRSKSKKFRKSTTSHPDDVGGLSASSTKLFPCSECGFNFKCKESLIEHSPLYHPEKHFPENTKPDSLTHPQYKTYLIHLLNTEVDRCGSYKTGFKCVFCPKIFNNKRKHAVRLHLIKEHQDELLENFTQLQNDVSTEELSEIVKMPGQINAKVTGPGNEKKCILKQFCKTKKRMKPEHTCTVCQVRTTSLRKHEAQHHPETFLLLKQLNQISSEQFKLYCTHLIHKMAATFSKSQEGADKKLRYNCPQCPNSYADLQGCRNHLVLGHKSLLLVEIEKLQRTMKPEELDLMKSQQPEAKVCRKTQKMIGMTTVKCEICDIRLTQRGITIHMRKNHPNEFFKHYKCEVCLICKQRFRRKYWLDFHMISCHAEVVFENWKAPLTSLEKFKSYCASIIHREISQSEEVGEINGKFRYKCSYCTNTFCDTNYAQIHLVMGHKKILGRQLEEMQHGKKSGETFEDNDGFEATEVFCVKKVPKPEEEVFCGKSATKVDGDEIWQEDDDDDDDDDEMVDFRSDHDLNGVNLENVDKEIKVERSDMEVGTILPD